MALEDIYQSFMADELPGFGPIWELVRRTSKAPPDFDPLHFYRSSDEKILRSRARLTRLPNEEKALAREYRSSLRKQAKREKRRADRAERIRLGLPAKTSKTELPYKKMHGYLAFTHRRKRHRELLARVGDYFGAYCNMQGDFYYPPGGFRGWHTNKFDKAGWRMYIVDVEEPGKSFFRFKDPESGEMVTHRDLAGQVNFFKIDPEHLLWHCIVSPETHRWSKGFAIPDDWHHRVCP